jgi:undecaprenyl-diphosphatase
MSVVQAVVLGLIQGLTEFLPVSSSGHLVLVPFLFGWEQQSLAFDVALHLGTLVAVGAYFWRDLLRLAAAGLTQGVRTQEGRLAWAIALGTLPAAVAGLFLDDLIETQFRSPLLIAFNLALLGVILWAADRIGIKRKQADQVSMLDVVLVGVAQALALVPGVSRSGATMTAGLLRGFDRATAARISFLLSFPVILGAGLVKIRHMELTAPYLAGMLTAAVSGYLVIRFLLQYLRRGSFAVFAVYRVALAVVIVLLLLSGR